MQRYIFFSYKKIFGKKNIKNFLVRSAGLNPLFLKVL